MYAHNDKNNVVLFECCRNSYNQAVLMMSQSPKLYSPRGSDEKYKPQIALFDSNSILIVFIFQLMFSFIDFYYSLDLLPFSFFWSAAFITNCIFVQVSFSTHPYSFVKSTPKINKRHNMRNSFFNEFSLFK